MLHLAVSVAREADKSAYDMPSVVSAKSVPDGCGVRSRRSLERNTRERILKTGTHMPPKNQRKAYRIEAAKLACIEIHHPARTHPDVGATAEKCVVA